MTLWPTDQASQILVLHVPAVKKKKSKPQTSELSVHPLSESTRDLLTCLAIRYSSPGFLWPFLSLISLCLNHTLYLSFSICILCIFHMTSQFLLKQEESNNSKYTPPPPLNVASLKSPHKKWLVHFCLLTTSISINCSNFVWPWVTLTALPRLKPGPVRARIFPLCLSSASAPPRL